MSDLVCISIHPWNLAEPIPIVHLMHEMSARHKVVYIQPPHGRLLDWSWRGRVTRVPGLSHPIVVAKPPAPLWSGMHRSSIKGNGSDPSKVNPNLVRWTHRLLKAYHIESPTVVCAQNPFFGKKLKGRLNERSFCYYMSNEGMSVLEGCPGGMQLQKELIHSCDRVISTGMHSSSLVTRLPQGVSPVLFPPNGLSRRGKVMAYLGPLDRSLDTTMLKWTLDNLPQWRALLIGPRRDDEVVEMLRHPRIEIHEQANIPKRNRLYGKMSVGILPLKGFHRREEVELSVHRYLSLGLPIVASGFAGSVGYEEFICTAHSPGEFMERIAGEMRSDDLQRRDKRSEYAKRHHWSERAVRMEKILAV